MFELIQVLNSEARRVFFGTVMDVFKSGRREVTTGDILASVLRAPSLANDLRGPNVNLDALFASLAAPRPGDGTYEKLQRAIDTESSEDTGEDPLSDLGLSRDGGFVGLPLSSDARTVFGQLRTAFAGAAEESVTPREVLVAILRSDGLLRTDCAEFGLRLEDLA